VGSGFGLLFIGLVLLGCGGQPPTPAMTVEAVIPTVTAPTAAPTATAVPEPTADPNVAPSLAWTYDAGGAINHPPLPVGDVVIAAPAQGPLIALDIATGALRWQFDPPARIWDRAYTSDGRFLFVGIEGGRLVALDAQTGEVQWEKTLGINVQHPPVVAEGILYVPTTFVGTGLLGDPSGKAVLFALNPEDGRELWAFESDNYILQSPFRFGDTVYLSGSYEAPEEVEEGGQMRLYALSAADGRVRWTYESDDGFPKQLYANETAVAYIAYQDFANGIDARSGELLWRKDTGNWVPTLSGAADIIYFGSANTVVHALNVTDGTVAWKFDIPEGTFNYLLGAPVRASDTLYFLTQQGDIMALNALNGVLRWHIGTDITSHTGLSVSDGWLFIGDDKGVVYAFK